MYLTENRKKSMLTRRHFSISNGGCPIQPSSNIRNKMGLISAIDAIYNEEWRGRGVFPFRVDYLKLKLLFHDDWILGPIEYYEYKRSEIPDLLYEMIYVESRNGYVWMNEWVDDGINMIGVYKMKEETDLFLMSALERVILSELCHESIAPITSNITTLNDVKRQHYAFLNRIQNVDVLTKIDLKPCMEQEMNERILKSFDGHLCKGVIFNLVKRILSLSIYDIKSDKFTTNNRIPPIGEITNVILHHFYQTVFDTVLEEKYPGITYTRWGHEVLIAIKQNEGIEYIDDPFFRLLNEIDLDGDLAYLTPDDYGCLPVCNGEKAILLDEEGCVSVWRYEDL